MESVISESEEKIAAHDASPLWDILDAARAILGFVENKTAEDYFRDRMRLDALVPASI